MAPFFTIIVRRSYSPVAVSIRTITPAAILTGSRLLNMDTSRPAARIPASITVIIIYLWFTVTSGVSDTVNANSSGAANAAASLLVRQSPAIQAQITITGRIPSRLFR